MPAMRSSRGAGCCRVAAIVKVDARGQLVLPSELRRAAGIGAGERLALLTWVVRGRTCCIALVRADELGGAARELIGPLSGARTGAAPARRELRRRGGGGGRQ
ncbi:MAG: HgcAB-associated protein [Thermoplasmata archaeon]